MKKLLLLFVCVLFSITVNGQVSVISQTNASCFGMCDAAVTISVTGGVSPYNLMVQNSACSASTTIIPFSGQTVTVYSLCPCSSAYNLMVFDAGATIVGMVNANITSPPQIISTISTTNICCFGMCNGAINGGATGGVPPYNYMLNGPTGITPFPSQNLCAGNYTLNVTDVNGCAYNNTTSISQPSALSITATWAPATCSSCCDGSITGMAGGGAGAYTYTISPPGIASYSVGGLCPGSYSICVKDACGCISCTAVTLPAGPTGITSLESSDDEVLIFPNPSSGNFQIKMKDISKYNYEVFDIVGNKISSGKAEEEIHLKNVSAGVYILQLLNLNGAPVARKKITINH